MKKTVAFLLAAAVLLSLCACGKAGEAPAEGPVSPPAGDEAEYELALTAEFLDLPAGMTYASAQCRVGDRVWLGGIAESGAVLGFVSPDIGSGGLVGLPEGCDFICAMCAYGDNIAVLAGNEAEMPEVEGEGPYEPEERLELLIFDGSEFVSETELAERYDSAFYAMLELDRSFYILSREFLIKLAPDGAELARFECSGGDVSMLTMCAFDGEIVAMAWDYSSFGMKFFRLDAQTLEPAGEAEIAEHMLHGMGVAGGALAVNTGSGVYALDGNFQLGEPLFEWDELFISGEYQEIEELDNGYLFFAPEQEQVCLARWRQARVRKTIVMATDTNYGSAFSAANDFNRSQDVYLVKVNVYEAYEEGALMRLQTEIGAGHWPDVFAFNFYDTLAEMRDELTLCNLYEFLDADPGLSREELMEPVLSAMEKDGALYWLPWKFSMATLVGPESLVGQAGISVEDALRIAGENELVPIEQWVTREDLLRTYSAAAIRQFVDWDSGTCSFDSEGFADILKLCGEMFANEDVTADNGNLYTGPHDPYLLKKYYVSSPVNLTALNLSMSGDYCFAGYPGVQGNGSLFNLTLRLAITAGAQEKEGAWAFISFLMGEEEQSAEVAGSNGGLSMNTAVFERKLEAILSDGYTDAFGDKREFTDDDARKLREVVYGAELVMGADPTLEKIISDCAAAYFAGEKSAEDAAKDIQGRAGIYVSERG